VIIECNKAEEWFKDKQQQQNALPKSANPVLLSSDVKKKTEFLDRYIEFPHPSGNCRVRSRS
jgi:heat shock protein 4